MPTVTPRVLVVEDDATVRQVLTLTLEQEGYEVSGFADGVTAVRAANDLLPDLAVVDIGLDPGPDGLTIARRLRATRDVPVIFVTAADKLEDRLAGFDAGADDYLVKPVQPPELLARVRAVLRRSDRLAATVVTIGELTVDEPARRATYCGQPLDLTRVEFDVLAAFARQPGRVLAKSQLLADVWGADATDPNLVEVQVSGLRRKLEAAGPRIVHTVRGAGYVLR